MLNIKLLFLKNIKTKTARGHIEWTTVGTAFQNDKGSISLRIPANIAVSSDVVLFPKNDDKAKDE